MILFALGWLARYLWERWRRPRHLVVHVRLDELAEEVQPPDPRVEWLRAQMDRDTA